MHSTYGTRQIANVTELRTNTTELVDYANETGEAILVQRNHQPYAVLLSVKAYEHHLTLARSCVNDVGYEDPRE